MGVMMPKPKRESANEIVLARTDWEALREAVEEADDVAAVMAARAKMRPGPRPCQTGARQFSRMRSLAPNSTARTRCGRGATIAA